MSRRLKQLIAVALAVAASMSIVTTAQAASGMEVALQDDFAFLQQIGKHRPKAFALAKQLKVSRLRVNVNWASVLGTKQASKRRAPKHISYHWVFYDSLLDASIAQGIKLQLALTGPAPAWATGNHKIGPVTPKASAYRAFVRAAVTHFGSRVDRYSIWNEPNYVGWISPLSRAPAVYRSLYQVGYSTIKSINPSATVLIGETSPYAIPKRATAPLAFLRKMASGGGLVADGYAHHPYDFDHPPTFQYPGANNATLATLGHLTSLLDQLGASGALTDPKGKPLDLYLTEYGYFRSGHRRVSPSRQASYLVQAFNMAQQNPRVHEMLEYLLLQPSKRYRFFDTSIASSKGAPTPAFNALKAWAQNAAATGAILNP